MDMLPLPSTSSIHPYIGLIKEIWHVLYTLLPPGGVAMPPGGAMHRRGRSVARDGGLPVDVSAGWLPGFEG